MTHRPPLEVTRDLPRSYQAKLLNKYTQTPGSGQQRRIAASDPSTDDFFSDSHMTAVLIHVNSIRTFKICFTVHAERVFFASFPLAMCETFMCKSNCCRGCRQVFFFFFIRITKCFTTLPVSEISHNDYSITISPD